jgi:peptidoglycan/xylan/chitin deacetylase (PgdA/CDA1 family)
MSETPRTAVPVLLYHSVPEAPGDPDPLSVTLERFEAHLEAIRASGRTPVTIDALAARLRGDGAIPERPVAITFDDAYDNTVAAIQLIESYGLSTTVYVTTGQVDTEAMLRSDQLEWLAARPALVELGAHTVTHPHLDELGLDEVVGQVRESKLQMEKSIGRAVTTFAYPYGSHDKHVRQAVIEAGFNSAAAVKNAISHLEDDPWAIARWTVRHDTSAEQIARILDGRDAPYAWQKERLRTRGYRRFRRLRRRLRRND